MKYYPCDICKHYTCDDDETEDCANYAKGWCNLPNTIEYHEKSAYYSKEYLLDKYWSYDNPKCGIYDETPIKYNITFDYKEIKEQEPKSEPIKPKPIKKKKITPSLTGEFPRKITW